MGEAFTWYYINPYVVARREKEKARDRKKYERFWAQYGKCPKYQARTL